MSWLEPVARLAVLHRLSDRPGPLRPEAVRSVIVVRNDNIGDVICTTPVLANLRAAFPKARLAALVCTMTQEVWEGHPALDRLYVYPKASHGQHSAREANLRLAATLRQIRRDGYDLALGVRSTWSATLGWMTYATKARWRVGPAAPPRKALEAFYFNLPMDPSPAELHEVERCLLYLRHIRVDSADKSLYLKVPGPAHAAAERFMQSHGLRAGGPVVLNITRPRYSPERQWPAESYGALAQALAGRPGGLVVTCGPAEVAFAHQALQGVTPAPPLYQPRGLKEFAAIIERARVFITPEGGPMHLGAAVGAPLVVLWGKAPVAQWRPWGVPSELVAKGGRLKDIDPRQVLEALDRLEASLAKGDRIES